MIRMVKDAREEILEQAAMLQHRTFPHSYRNKTEAMDDLLSILKSNGLLFVSEAEGVLTGVVGAIKQYPVAWELHPLIVTPEKQGGGVGRELMKHVEDTVREQGGKVIYLGTDDEHFKTSLSHGDLFVNLFEKIQNVENLNRHPYEFYHKCGYAIVGVIPDANGFNKPDILMAKRLVKYEKADKR